MQHCNLNINIIFPVPTSTRNPWTKSYTF